ncbi:glycosyltransferase [Pseudomonadota bacterium]
MPELAVIIPTYNEVENVAPMVRDLGAVLDETDWEVIFVDDDSPDGTIQRVQELGRHDPRVRGLLRVGRRGLSSACVEGMLASNAAYLAVMDADHQHDVSLLTRMLMLLRSGQADIVIGSRYTGGGSASEGLGAVRSAGSKLATRLSRLFTRQRLSDPMSGYFMVRREVLDETVKSLYGKGFKILLDILSAHPGPLRVAELPYDMQPRAAGESKLDASVVVDFLMLLLNARLRGFVPLRFFLFAAVGLTGVAVHMGLLYAVFALLGQQFAWSQALATFVAMTSNFFLNNVFTFRDRRLRGVQIIPGLLSFYLACGVGALINVAFASFLFERGLYWALAGLAGAFVGAIWNFSLSSYFTWRNPLPGA